MLEEYQDLWVKGACAKEGARDCDGRYAPIKEFCKKFKRPFTVLDLGAHRGYFSVRLTEDFDCTAVAVEHDLGLTEETLLQNENPRIIHLHKRITLDDIDAMARCEHFDVVLALSFIHHQGVPFPKYVEHLLELGDHLIVEVAMEPTASGQECAKGRPDDLSDATIIAQHPAHFGTQGLRSMAHWYRRKTKIARPFIGCMDLPCRGYPVESSFEDKWINGRRFLRGINLRTFDAMNGVYPSRDWIAGCLERRGRPAAKHGDIGPHNVILQGDDAVLIDGGGQHQNCTDERGWDRLVVQRDWGIWT